MADVETGPEIIKGIINGKRTELEKDRVGVRQLPDGVIPEITVYPDTSDREGFRRTSFDNSTVPGKGTKAGAASDPTRY